MYLNKQWPFWLISPLQGATAAAATSADLYTSHWQLKGS